MTAWIFPVNEDDIYDIHSAFKELDRIYWGLKDSKMNVNDIVYLYISSPEQRIRYMLLVESIVENHILPEADRKYWKNEEELSRYDGKYVVLIPIMESFSYELSLKNLRDIGLLGEKEIFQGRRNDKVTRSDQNNLQKERLLGYIKERFKPHITSDYPDETDMSQ